MGLYENWPYTNFHELNLNWMIGIVRQAEETMGKLSQTINGIVDDRLKDFQKQFEESEARIQSALTQMQTQINASLKEVQDSLALVNGRLDAQDARIEALERDLNNSIQEAIKAMNEAVRAEIERLTNLVNQMVDENNQWKIDFENGLEEWKATLIKEQADWLAKELDAFLKTLPDVQNVLVVSPVSGKVMTIGDALQELYETMRLESITAGEYDRLQLTAGEYDSWRVDFYPTGLTAFQYDSYAKRYLINTIEQTWVWHPLLGKRVPAQQVIDFNTEMIRSFGTLTAGEYDSKMYTAGEYDDLDLEAIFFDFASNTNIRNSAKFYDNERRYGR